MIQEIKLKNVRKFGNLDLSINSNKVILEGSNAIGKTTPKDKTTANADKPAILYVLLTYEVV